MSSNDTWKIPLNAAEVLDYVDIYDWNVIICFILAPWLYIYYNAVSGRSHYHLPPQAPTMVV